MAELSERLRCNFATELESAQRRLESLAEYLCLDEAVSSRHAERLQEFDEIAQSLGELAAFLFHNGTALDALASIRLDKLRERLDLKSG